MPLRDRAAQFAPFAALTGYEEVIDETARHTEERRELAEDAQALLDRRLRYLAPQIAEKPPVTIVYFVPDPYKKGGKYRHISGRLDAIFKTEQTLHLADGTVIPIRDLITLDSPLLEG